MIWLGYFIICFALIRLLVSLINCTTNIYLPKVLKIDQEPLVSILIPARNEEENIGNILADIAKLSYSNYEAIVYDDSSTDSTSEIVKSYSSKNSRIKLVAGIPLEAGWQGKSYACYQLSLIATGRYYLYLDADVRVSGSLIEKSIYYTRRYNLGLLSIFPKQIMSTAGEAISVPIMNRILLSLLPLVFIRAISWKSFSAANGQFMLFDAEIYRKHQPHLKCKSAKAEDIAICRYYKKEKVKVATLLGDGSIRCRMYKSIHEAINGFSKNIFSFFGSSIPATLLYALTTTFAPLAVIYIFGIEVLLAYAVILVLIQLYISIASQQNIFYNIALLPVQQFVFLWVIFAGISKKATSSLEWKGRNIADLQ